MSEASDLPNGVESFVFPPRHSKGRIVIEVSDEADDVARDRRHENSKDSDERENSDALNILRK